MNSGSLDVYFKGKLAGELAMEENSLLFSYNKYYLKDSGREPLSVSLPLREEPFPQEAMLPYFLGLLPEGPALERAAALLDKEKDDLIGLLGALGCDCAGAVTFGSDCKLEAGDYSYEFLDDRQASELLESLENSPLRAQEGGYGPVLPGEGSKLAACLIDGRLALPLGGTPSTHVIKPSHYRSRSRFDNFIDPILETHTSTVFNEFFCMTLASRCGLNVPACSVVHFGEVPYYAVERFDRARSGDSWQKIHQEDLCQALGVIPDKRYEADGGPSLKDCFGLLLDIGSSAACKIGLLDLVIYNFLIGNINCHAKKYSLIYKDKLPRLAPGYALRCGILTHGEQETARLAMDLGGEHELSRIDRENFEKLSEISTFRADFAAKRVDRMCQAVWSQAKPLADELNADHKTASPVYEKIINIIKSQIDKVFNAYITSLDPALL